MITFFKYILLIYMTFIQQKTVSVSRCLASKRANRPHFSMKAHFKEISFGVASKAFLSHT